jgi:hypothetical protein
MPNNIVKVTTALKNLGATVPTGVWADIKSKENFFVDISFKDDESGEEYISKSALGVLRSVYQKLYEEPNYPTTENLSKQSVQLTTQYKYVIEGKGFNDSEELRIYLSQILKSYKEGQSLTQQDKAFLGDLLSRSSIIKDEVNKYGKVVDLIVAIKPGHKSKTFHIVYSNGRKQSISMKNYVDPGKEILVNIWD